jgi:hypothetical protein
LLSKLSALLAVEARCEEEEGSRTMENLNRPDAAAALLEDVMEPVLLFLPPGNIRNLRAASRAGVKEAIHGSTIGVLLAAMLILGERRLPTTLMEVRYYYFCFDNDGKDDNEDDDAFREESWVSRRRVYYQIQTFRFALSVKSDLIDHEESCNLTRSRLVQAQVTL